MAPETDLAENELRRQLATLALSHVQPAGAMEAIAAAAWWTMRARLGLRVPLVVVHDFGLLLSRNREGSRREVARSSPTPALARYRGLLAGLASSEVIQDLGTTPLRDETVAVILARLIGDVYLRWTGRPRTSVDIHELPMSSPAYDGDRVAQARELDPAWSHPFIQRLVEHERAVLARLDQIDAGVLRLLGLFSFQAGVSDLADLYQVVSTSGAADIVDFSLQLLPSLLETKRRPAAQRFSIDGYASVERRGNLDGLLPGELAHDDEIFTQKALSDDLLYYGHERQHETGRKLHYMLIDASASMRGARQVFARGLALALAKKFSLLGGEVWSTLLRQPPARAPGRRHVGAARAAAAAVVPFGARAQLRARLRGARDRGGPPSPRAGARHRAHVHHPRRVPHPDGDGGITGARRVSLRHLHSAVEADRPRILEPAEPLPGGDRRVVVARGGEAAARAGDRRGRRQWLGAP